MIELEPRLQDDLIWCDCGNIAWVYRFQKRRDPIMRCRVCNGLYSPDPEKLDRHMKAVEELRANAANQERTSRAFRNGSPPSEAS